MDARAKRIDTFRILGTIVVAAGLLITIVGLTTDDLPAAAYVLAGMLVVIGSGLRIEAAVTDRR